MNGQYRRLTEQPPVDMKEIYGWLKAANLSAATERLVVAAQSQAFRLGTMSTIFYIVTSVLLAACAV